MGTIKMIFGIFVVVMMVYLGAEVIPPYFSNYEFEDALKTEALIATNSSKTEADIRESVFKKAQDLGIPITKDVIKTQRTGTQGSGVVSIDATYTVRLYLPGYSTDLHFDASAANKGAF
jgi:hypothetical protein